MAKRIKGFIIVLIVFSTASAYGQGIYNNGVFIKIGHDTYISASGSNCGYTVQNNGSSQGLLELNGQLRISGNFTNNNSDGGFLASDTGNNGWLVFQQTGIKRLRGVSEVFTFNNIKIQNSAILVIQPQQAVTINGNLVIANPQGLEIRSDNTHIGSLITYGNIANVTGGSAIDQRYVSHNGSNRWEYISSPISNASSLIFTSPLRSLWYVNETINTFVSIPHTTPAGMEIMRGYARKYVLSEGDGNTLVDFTGSLNTGYQFSNLSRTETAPGSAHGWNLVGNPYPSAMDWDALSGWEKLNVDNAIYFRSNGNFASYVEGVGTNGGTQFIPPMQAYWVRVKAGQTIGLLASENTVRVHNAHNTYKTYPSLDNNLSIKVTNLSNNLSDETYLRFGPYADNAFNGDYDAFKMFAAEATYPQVYTPITGAGDISINSFEPLNGEFIVPLGFNTSLNGQFVIEASLVPTLTANGNTVFLEDLLTGFSQDLSLNNIYQFSSPPASGYNRFVLHFNPVTVTLPENDQNSNTSLNIFAHNNEVFINSTEILDGTLSIYNVSGQLVAIKELSGVNSSSLKLNHASGIYIARYTSPGQNFVRRISVFSK